MKIKLLLTAVITTLILLSSGCYRRDVQVLRVKVPAMKNDACATLVYQAFISTSPQMPGGFIEGIKNVQTDVDSKIVTVQYDSTKIAIKNLEYLVCGAGFEANGNPPKPGTQEKLPQECK